MQYNTLNRFILIGFKFLFIVHYEFNSLLALSQDDPRGFSLKTIVSRSDPRAAGGLNYIYFHNVCIHLDFCFCFVITNCVQ